MGRFGILSDDCCYGDTSSPPPVGAPSLFLPSPAQASASSRFRSDSKDEVAGVGGGGTSSSSSSSSSSTRQDLEYSDDETDGERSTSSDDENGDEEEPQHPLGFSAPRRSHVRGPSSRYAVDWLILPKESSVEAYKKRMGYSHSSPLRESLLDPAFAASPPRQQFPPLGSYIDPATASTLDLVEVARSVSLSIPIPTAGQPPDGNDDHRGIGSGIGDDDDDDDEEFNYKTASAAIRDREVQEIVDLFATTLGGRASTGRVRAIGHASTVARDPMAHLSVDALAGPYRAMQTDQRQVKAEVESVRGDILKDHKDRRHRLTRLIREQEDAARRIQDEIDRQRVDAERADMQRQVEEQERLEGERRRAVAAQREKDDEEDGGHNDGRNRRQREQEAAREQQIADQERVEAARAAAKPEFVSRAHKLVSQLVQVRASVEPFEASTAPTVKRRRLQMKKLVAGKVNTLTENADKIRSVAAEVSRAIAAAREEDEQAKQQLSAGAPGLSPEMARGKRYLIDLLSSKVIVRVQAEGFNGTRGDGFPLANMLALVSADSKEINSILTAHIYTVCPTAIPFLPDPAPNASEEELMESLGMLKNDDGTFETFERFLHRTESIVSLVAEIMASNPPSHSLLGGHEAAITWLSRFLDLLPKAPESPLPLLTAPVLDAFLTGAGHMLANKHPDDFKIHLDTIMNDILKRIDEGPDGAPSATRLRKTVGDGFASFKRNLPSKALPELYYGASESAGHAKTSFASTLGTPPPSKPNPFGPPAVSNPFQTSAASQPFVSSSSTALSFGGSSTTGSKTPSQSPFLSGASPFGSAPAAPTQSLGSTIAPTPFTSSSSSTMMDSGMDAADAPSASPFTQAGGLGFAGMATSSFSSSAPSPFASTTAPSPGPFTQPAAPSSFGAAVAPSPSQFGAFGPAAPSSSLFGSSAPAQASFTAAGGFGMLSSSAQNPSPFGSAPSNPSPFGSTQNPSPFGPASSSPSPFSTAFGSASSHQSPFGVSTSSQNPPALGSAPANPSPFTSSVLTTSTTPFGAEPISSSPFGTSATPFGQAPSQSPFGRPAMAGTSLIGFGTSSSGQASSTTFGTSFGSPFGAPASTPFSSNPQQQQSSAYGGRKRIPCRYFAQGNCRFGANCNYSHDSPAQSFNTPFGGPRR